jgi:uncharacterized membrane protein
VDSAIKVLVWWIVFSGTHTVLSHPPIRSRLVSRLGEGAFQGVYSLIAFATFVPLMWTFLANRSSHAVPLPMLAMTPGIWWVTMLLNLFAVVLLVLGFSRPNPVSSLTARPGSSAMGVLRITRHPAFMGVAILGLSHLLVNYSAIDRVFFGGTFLYSLLGSAHQDWRRRLSADPELGRFFAETSFFPFVAIATGRNHFEPSELRLSALIAGVTIFGLVFVFHYRLFG